MIDYIRHHLFTLIWLATVVIVIGALVFASIQEQQRMKIRPVDDRGEKVPAGLDRDIRRAIGQEIPPQPGDRKWSNWFGSYIELTHYTSDNLYWFTVLSGLHAGHTYKNQSRWSILPQTKPADFVPRKRL